MMQSDSMIRLMTEAPLKPNQIMRNEIAAQVDEFLANGGQIEVLETRVGHAPQNTVRLQQTGKFHVEGVTHRIEIGGVEHVSMYITCNMTGYAPNTIRKRVAAGEFPAPQMKDGRLYFPKATVVAWMAVRDE